MVEKPCDIVAKHADPNELILRLFEGSGVQVFCPHLSGTVALMSEKTSIREVLNRVLHDRHYCWYALGYRIFVQRNPTIKRVSQGSGYIKNLTTGCVTLLKPPVYRGPTRTSGTSARADDMIYVDVIEEGWYYEEMTVVW